MKRGGLLVALTALALLASLAVLTSARVARAENDARKPAAKAESEQRDTDLERAASRAAGVPSAREFGMAVANLQGRYAVANKPAKVGDARHTATIGFNTRIIYGDVVGYAFSLGFEAGGTFAPGLAYGIDVLPVGGALAIGKRGFFTLGTGVGVGGVAPELIPFAVRFPMEARLELEPIDGLRTMLGVNAAITPFTSARRSGAPRGPGVDEIGVQLLFGKQSAEQHGAYASWTGYFWGLDYREQMGSPFIGLVAGLNLGSAL